MEAPTISVNNMTVQLTRGGSFKPPYSVKEPVTPVVKELQPTKVSQKSVKFSPNLVILVTDVFLFQLQGLSDLTSVQCVCQLLLLYRALDLSCGNSWCALSNMHYAVILQADQC